MILENRTNFGAVPARIFIPYAAKIDLSGFESDLEVIVKKQADLVEYSIGGSERGSNILGIVTQGLTFTAVEH